jgi:hypothetical protein
MLVATLSVLAGYFGLEYGGDLNKKRGTSQLIGTAKATP